MDAPGLGFLALVLGCCACSTVSEDSVLSTREYIAWREHRIDDEMLSGVRLRGADGLELADLNGDGHDDIVSVHESDVEYDGVPDGHVRIAFGSADPHGWANVTLAEGREAGAAEDVAIADMNGDGYPDVVAACELAHLIYFENPGRDVASAKWQRHIPTATLGRGSFIRVFLADLNKDGRAEVIAANKGAQTPRDAAEETRSISIFELDGEPLQDESWIEYVVAELPWPINARPVDIDNDGDTDIVGGSVAEKRIFWLENRSSEEKFDFQEHAITAIGHNADQAVVVNGFNMDFADMNDDGRLDIVTFDVDRMLGRGAVWLQQPESAGADWLMHRIGDYAPDQLVGVKLADIDGDGDLDVMTGGYSLGSRTEDGQAAATDALGRLAWFENPGQAGLEWGRHEISRRERGMFDMFIAKDMDGDGDIDFVGTRGNSGKYDGVFWLEQIRSREPGETFVAARDSDSPEVPLP